jgi:hypothetical protein
MKVLTSTLKVISIEGEWLEGIYFPKYDVFKEVSVFGFSLHGRIINNEAFLSIEDAEDFLKLLENNGQDR